MGELESLKGILDKYSRCVVLEKDGSRILILERGARVLGVFLGDSPNLLWVNPKIEDELHGGGWNVGGLRLWISPERNFFYRNPERFEDWFCPQGLDPGDYRIVEAGSERVVLDGELRASDNLAGKDFKAQVRREVWLLEGRRGRLRFRVRERMIGEYHLMVNPWVLVQVPTGYADRGTVIVPVKKKAEPIHYFVGIPGDRLKVSANHISFKIDGNLVTKLGIRPEDLREPGSGSIGYVYRISKGSWSALFLKTSNIPLSQEECLDVPKLDPNLPRAAVQAYNSGPEAYGEIRFGEIELQFTPTQNVAGRIFGSIEYDFIATVGARNDILKSIKRILGIPKPHLY